MNIKRLQGSNLMSGRRSSKHGTRTYDPSTSLMGSKVVSTKMEHLRQNEVAYKSKIRTLEVEVETLKGRLDSLRKAKNTTIVHREREEVRISSPYFGRVQTSSHSLGRLPSLRNGEARPQTSQECSHQEVKELNAQVAQLDTQLLSERVKYEQQSEGATKNHIRELTNLKKLHDNKVLELTAEIDQLKEERTQEKERQEALQSEVDRLCTENSELTNRIQEVLESNERLRNGSLLLQERAEALLEELSLKEAEWSQTEDRLKAEAIILRKTGTLTQKGGYLEQATKSHAKEMTDLKKLYDDKILKLTTEMNQLKKEKAQEMCRHEAEVERLHTENSELTNQIQEVLDCNEGLRKSSLLLQERSQALLEELSLKEAEWSQREDKLKAEIRAQWGDRYHEWIKKAEKKMDELQQINSLLQSMLKTKKENDL